MKSRIVKYLTEKRFSLVSVITVDVVTVVVYQYLN